MVETKGFNSQDGIALRWLKRYGVDAGVISGRNSPAVIERARQLDFRYVYQGNYEKIPMIEEILREGGYSPEEIAFVGDDFTDVVVMRRVGLGIATGDARPEVKAIADYVCEAEGGRGALREVAEQILKAKGDWDKILEHYQLTGE
jgi:3-deoxy-D-manno-octulosonate 8-phosphate phosphatase (KDO 8-P phosphatase)